jgi:tRNA nucleotidyltransferase (CCA-adding enzyme)
MNKKLRKEDNQSPDKRVTVITTHINADYDAIGSMLAAHKLYPDSVVVFPGSHEKNMTRFFISSLVYLFNMVDVSAMDTLIIDRFVLVDTKQKTRLGVIQNYLEGKEIHIYDHHPASEQDIKGDYECFRETGATTSILTEMIREKGVYLSPDEATILCLGIYEDTGSFTFSSTTEADFHAAAYLLSKGANLDIISSLISKEINPRQLACLNDMLQSQAHHRINGVDIVITSISTEEYINDFSSLVHKMIQMENIEALFAIARMGDKVYVVARSKIPEVDAGAIITSLGCGGHSYAASATIKDKTLAQTENLLFDVLQRNVKSGKSARSLMSSPAITVSPEISCDQAAQTLTRYNINSVLVVKDEPLKENILGFITRQVLEKALYHKLENSKVSEFMTLEVMSADVDAQLEEIQDIIIEYKQRIVPIIENKRIIGVITRTDLLNILVQRSQTSGNGIPDPMAKPFYAKTKNIIAFIKERLSEELIGLLRKIGKVGSDLGFSVYVVGGFVRDLLLYRENDDVDIVIEGNGILFARTFAEMENARVNTYEKFGTAVIIFKNGFKIDVASARMEYYKSPAALPEVEMSSIKLDLYRRDFTINTLAIRLDPGHFGTLIDFFSAQRDLKDKTIRVIHNLSFVEDPTRVFRAIRFEQRFGFTIGKLTSGLVKNAVRMDFFKKLSGLRVFSELKQILEEENPVPAIIRMSEYNLFPVIHPELALNKATIRALDSAKKVIAWHDLLFVNEPLEKWAIYMMMIVRKCPRKVTDDISRRLLFKPLYDKMFNKERFRAEGCLYWLETHPEALNSDRYQRLSLFRPELILSMMAVTENEDLKKKISHYYTYLRGVTISIQGRDLKEMGITPGPHYKKILEDTLFAKLNGQLATREDELRFVESRVTHHR